MDNVRFLKEEKKAGIYDELRVYFPHCKDGCTANIPNSNSPQHIPIKGTFNLACIMQEARAFAYVRKENLRKINQEYSDRKKKKEAITQDKCFTASRR